VTTRGVIALTAYIAAIVAANWLTTRYGIVPTGFGYATTAGTYAAGAALLLRDVVQDTCGWRWVIATQTVGGQLVGKMLWATALPVAVVLVVRQVRRGPVSRHSLGA
jgi:hypothetical protein